MQPGSVQEHGAEQRNEGAGQRYVAAYMERRRQPRRQYSKLHGKDIAFVRCQQHHFIQKNQNVQTDQQISDVRSDVLGSVVADGYHAGRWLGVRAAAAMFLQYQMQANAWMAY